MEHSGHRQRMRERYAAQGLGGFAQHEVLELLLFYAIPQKNVNPLAHTLIDRFGSLYNVLHATRAQLMQVEGVGEYAAALLTLFAEAPRAAELTRLGRRVTLGTRRAAVDYCARLLSGEKREMFYAICLNGQMETLADVLIARGSLSDVPAYPRVVMDAVLTHNAHGVLLCHNHPGGAVAPSQADLDATATLSRLLMEVEVALVDHIIIAEGEALSMVRNGFIRQTATEGGVETHVANSAGEVRFKRDLKIDRPNRPEDA